MSEPRILPAPFSFELFASGETPRRKALFLDYDGTLADFCIDRRKAVPSREVEELLVRLSTSTHGRVAIISGRTVQELRNLLGEHISLELWGDYGWERWRPGDDVTIWTAPRHDAVIFMEAAAIAAPYFDREDIEIKTASIAVHTRRIPEFERERASDLITRLWSPLARDYDLQLLPFNGGFELRDIMRTKGTAIRELRSELSLDTHICYLGDDFADEDAFVEVGKNDWSILVAPVSRPTSARFWMRPSADVIRFLYRWMEWEGGSHVTERFSQQRSTRFG